MNGTQSTRRHKGHEGYPFALHALFNNHAIFTLHALFCPFHPFCPSSLCTLFTLCILLAFAPFLPFCPFLHPFCSSDPFCPFHLSILPFPFVLLLHPIFAPRVCTVYLLCLCALASWRLGPHHPDMNGLKTGQGAKA